ncbi:MAG TPA: hypothetical protein PKA55_03770 [Rhodoblastus sp.]|nr:hypothetical protein [Rhodoblastus sp.]
MKAALRALATIGALAGAPAHASDGARPFELIRQMQDMQDGVSTGVELRQDASDDVLARFVSAVRSGQVDWADGRNRAALMFYLLTGGEADLVRPALELAPKDVSDRKALEQAFQYADAAHSGAEAALDVIDPRDVSPEVAGAVALAQARFVMERDRPAARDKLRAARILAPGGLIEEMSLRQEMRLLDSVSELADLQGLVERYFVVFSKSVYAPRFLKDFESLGERIWKEQAPDKRAAMLNALGLLPDEARMRIGLRLARAALVHGDRTNALSTINATCGPPRSGSSSDERCALYRVLAVIYDDAAVPAAMSQSPSLHLETVDRLLRHCARMLMEDGDASGAGAPHERDTSSERGDEQSAATQGALAQIEDAERLLASRQ